MKSTLLLLAAALGVAAQDNTLTPQEKKDGWVLLFDGQTMNALGGSAARRLRPATPGPSRTSLLKTVKHPRLHGGPVLEAKRSAISNSSLIGGSLPRGNSGVKYRIQDHFWIAPDDRRRALRKAGGAISAESDPAASRRRARITWSGFEYQITDDTSNRDATSNVKHTRRRAVRHGGAVLSIHRSR